jgi:Fe-S-cluster-containing hydrogenase component 2
MDAAYMSRGVMALLRRVPAFAELEEKLLATLRSGARLRNHGPGEVIVREGEVGDAFFLIRGGSVVVSKRVGDEERTVSYLASGKYFGEMALLAGTPRTATVRAVTATELVCIEREIFTSTLAQSPAASAALERAMRRRERGTEAVMASESLARALAFVTEQGALGSADELLVVDLDRCTYCGECEAACQAAFGTSRMLLHGPAHGGLLFPTACRNCTDPLCTLRCPVDAIARDACGEVHIEQHCIGCGQCALHCPYGTIVLAPRSEGDGESARQRAGLKRPVTRQAVKCDLCQGDGGPPRCVRSCPTAALRALDAEAVLRQILGAGA